MLCKNCGRPVVDGVCANCGAQQPAGTAADPQPKTPPLLKRLLTLALVAVLLFGGGLALLVAYQNERKPIGALEVTPLHHATDTVASYMFPIDNTPIDETAAEPWRGTLTPGYWTAGYDFPAGYYVITEVSGFGVITTNNQSASYLYETLQPDSNITVTSEIFLSRGTVLMLNGTTVLLESTRADVKGLTPRIPAADTEFTFRGGSHTVGVDFPAGVYDILCQAGAGVIIGQREDMAFSIYTSLSTSADISLGIISYHGVVLTADTTLIIHPEMTVRVVPTTSELEKIAIKE